MITTTNQKHLIKGIKAALRISDRKARSIIDTNWFSLPETSLRDCIVTVLPDSLRIDINAPGTTYETLGYYVLAASLSITDEDLAAWKRLPIEEAYAVRKDVKFYNDTESFDGKLIDAQPKDEDGIVVTVKNFETQETLSMAMLAEIGTAQELLAYANGVLNTDARIVFERAPIKTRAHRSNDLPIVEFVMTGNNRTNEDGTPFQFDNEDFDLMGQVDEMFANA